MSRTVCNGLRTETSTDLEANVDYEALEKGDTTILWHRQMIQEPAQSGQVEMLTTCINDHQE